MGTSSQDREGNFVHDFMTGAGLTTTSDIRDLPPTDDVMTNSKLELIAETVSTSNKLMSHMSDMFGAVKSQSGTKNMVVEREADVRAWIESNLPDSYPFGMFVDMYVIL
eukprot:9808806-Ditylum_brightwellii.AAC.1